MKQSRSGFSQRYVAELRRHLKQGTRARLPCGKALGLGRQAAALGLETLELARIHEQALATIKLSNRKNGLSQRAECFFTAANTPIEETHRAARQSQVHLSRMEETLGQRTEELAAINRELQRRVVRRKVAEDVTAKTGQHYKKCLEESLQLQQRLRQLTYRVLTAQEEDRRSISRELHDEIAQTLLAINVRLLSLKQVTRVNTKGLKNEIASAQRLVARSVRSVRRVAREFRRL